VLRELEEAEQRKLNELLEAVVRMLAGNLLAVIDLGTLAQLQDVRDILQTWLLGDSELTHERMLASVMRLTERLLIDPALHVDRNEMTMH
jgi:hypothetical protein